MQGSETTTLINSDMPDCVDLLTDIPSALSKYDYLIDLTCDPKFAAEHGNICSAEDIPALAKKLLPCYVEGGLHWTVNKRKGGGFYLAVFNHSGVIRSVSKGEYVLPEASVCAKISFASESASPEVLEGGGKLKYENGEYRLTLSGGDWCLISF